MKRICAWCGNEMDQKPRPEARGVTHGLCHACRTLYFGRVKPAGAGPGQESAADDTASLAAEQVARARAAAEE